MENGHSMKQFFFLSFLFIIACQTDNRSISIPSPSVALDSSISKKNNSIAAKSRSLRTPDCPLKGKVLSTNKIWLPEEQLVAYIAADSATYDKKYGESHRKVAIYDAPTCKIKSEWTLPVNRSPDFPYYLADISYNNKNHLVAIKGVNTIHCIDLQTNKLLPPVSPSYKTKRMAQDAQSGSILRLELREEYLIGYAQDMGSFVFKISKNKPLTPLLPYAEYQVGETRFESLFLIPSTNNNVQAILPKYDWEKEKFTINPVFPAPVLLQPNLLKRALNKQYLVLKTVDAKGGIGIDLKSGNKVVLPDNLQHKSVQDIIAWMENRSLE